MRNISRISIITPVYNGMPYIEECVDSILSQTFQNWELLISDNGSVDGTRTYLDKLTDKRIRVFKQKSNLGIFGNLNFLLGKATAPIIQILCADDSLVNQDSLLSIVRYWQNQTKELGFVRFNTTNLEHWKSMSSIIRYSAGKVKPENSTLLFFIFGNIAGNLSNVSLRIDLINKVGLFRTDLPYAADFEYWVRAAEKVPFGLEQQSVTFVRRHANTSSIKLNKNGELVPQLVEIANSLYGKLIVKNRYSRFFLRLHAIVTYDTLQRDTGVKTLLRGNAKYFRQVNASFKSARYKVPLILCWLIYFISLGGRIGRLTIAKRILVQHDQPYGPKD